MSDQLHEVQWQHPVHGEIHEVVCQSHEAAVLRALRTLGIGCVGSYAVFDATCRRCGDPRDARRWLPDAVHRIPGTSPGL